VLSLGYLASTSLAIRLPVLPMNESITRSIHSNSALNKKVVIAVAVKNLPDEIRFSESELDQLYDLCVEYKNDLINRDELITKIKDIRGGDYVDVAVVIVFISIMIVAFPNLVDGFLENLPALADPKQPGRQKFYEPRSSCPGNHFDAATRPHIRPRNMMIEAARKAASDRGRPPIEIIRKISSPSLIEYANKARKDIKTAKNLDNLIEQIKSGIYSGTKIEKVTEYKYFLCALGGERVVYFVDTQS
jgi:hypothetical protein